MRKNGFTMVELIFVIIIIGILSVAAIPKFGDIKDRARISTEVALFSSLDSSIAAAIEFQYDDFSNRFVDWHDVTISGIRLDQRYTAVQEYNTNVNQEKSVLKKIIKKADNLKIVGAVSTNEVDIVAYGTATNSSNDILFIKGPASDATSGVRAPDVAGNDILGKPDRNDLWVFNPNSFDINITSTAAYPLHNSPTQIPAESVGLLDVNGTAQLAPGGANTNIRALSVVRSDTSVAVVANDVLEIRN